MVVFVRVVDSGSFSAAARQLGMSPSAVSRSVARLEKALAVRLLQRTTRKLRLSDPGEEVARRCREVVEAARAVADVGLHDGAAPAGLVRISIPKAVGRFLVHPHMPAFLARYPQIDVHLRLEDRYVDFIDDNVDLAIRITDRPAPGLAGRPLLSIDHLLCATPAYLACHGTPVHPADLADHSCLYLGETPGDSRWRFRKQGKTVAIKVSGRYAANHTGVRLDAVLHDIGIGSLPYFVARRALATGDLVAVLTDWQFLTGYQGVAWLLYPPTRYLPAKLRVFIDYLVEALRAEPTMAQMQSSD